MYKKILLAFTICLLTAPQVLALAAELTPQQKEEVKLKSAVWGLKRQKALELTKAKKFAEVEAIYKQIIEERRALNLDLLSELDLLTTLYLNYDKNDLAEATAREMVDSREKISDSEDPTLAYPLEQLAKCLDRIGKKDEAISARARAAKIQKDAQSIPHFGKILLPPGAPARIKEAEEMRLLGQKYMRLDLQSKALAYFDRAVALDSKNAQAYKDRASAESWFDMTTKAINDLNLAIKLKPDFVQAYFDRGMAYESLSQYPRALSDFGRAIALNPRDIESLGTRGKLLDVMGKHKEAIADYTRAIASDTTHYWPYVQRAVAYTSLKQYQDAINDYTTLIERAPDDYEYYEYRRDLYIKAGDKAKAQADQKTISQLKSKLK